MPTPTPPVFDDRTIEELKEPTDVRGEPVYYGPHRICFELASGGMATVFLARTEGPGGFERLVALKRIHSHLANDEQFVRMFIDEARIASQISHPHVCSVFDFGQAQGTYYIAMQYLVGEPLHRVYGALVQRESLAREPGSTAHLLYLIADACEGLHAAHELRDPHGNLRQVIHRDVSPQNLIVTYSGQMSVVDFGIASATDRYQKTRTGHARGKTAYMAPERFRGVEIDRRVDVWSTGVVLWECLTSRRLFARRTPGDSVVAILHERVPPVTSIRPELPSELDAIVARALANDPDDRYPTTRDLGHALAGVASELGVASAADVADWMAELFPKGEGRRRVFVALATSTNDGPSRAPRGGTRSPHRKMRAAWPLLLAFGLGAAAASLATWAAVEVPRSPLVLAPEPPVSLGARMKEAPSREAAPAPPPKVSPEPAVAVSNAPAVAVEAPRIPSRTADGARADEDRPRNVPSQPPRTGTLTVVTPRGWAAVSEGSRSLGQTPVRLTLPVGEHVLAVRFGGEPPVKYVRVNVRAGGQERVSIAP